MSQPDRREKIAALLDSPNEGERAAARAALDRIPSLSKGEGMLPAERPAYGTPEWHAAILAWCERLQFCDSRRGSPSLSQAEVVLIRNWVRGRGTPWDGGAGEIERIYRKLVAADEQRALA